ncbi:ANTAR domain-containing response regulator [Microbaculum marinum]|uniref:ANTAR domain-containing protein n=1 Tax=Microbaculum marinum TaxID=1764581 RepID=A0AAW9RTS7_9HYPH
MEQSRHSFRAAKIGLLGCNAHDRTTLTRQLSRLGALPVPLEAVASDHLEGSDRLCVLVVDGEAELGEEAFPRNTGRHIAIVALVGSEAPSHLNRILRQSISAHMMKPVRSVGLFTALCIARQSFDVHSRLAGRVEKLEDRIRQRRFVFAAQLALMKALDISEEAAFARLRSAAMERRITIEEMSVELVEAGSAVSAIA